MLDNGFDPICSHIKSICSTVDISFPSPKIFLHQAVKQKLCFIQRFLYDSF